MAAKAAADAMAKEVADATIEAAQRAKAVAEADAVAIVKAKAAFEALSTIKKAEAAATAKTLAN